MPLITEFKMAVLSVAMLSSFSASLLVAAAAPTTTHAGHQSDGASPQPLAARRPLVFEPNRGQAPAQVKWIARASGYTLFLTREGVTMVLQDGAGSAHGSRSRRLAPVSFQKPQPSANCSEPGLE